MATEPRARPADEGAIGAPNSVEARTIDWPAASRAAEAAAREAQRLGVRVNVAIVDAGGNLAAFVRMPGAPLHSIEIAIDKAYTAVSFGLPTGRWNETLQAHSEAVRQGIVLRPRFVAFGGGLPITEDGQRIGGIGVSGGSEEQDGACAQAGLRALGLADT
ncbi:GlcG/HbpS family heme-binding protein [Paraburkholderia heleia]|uniref:GlcG/HbpS family heme-binding protein n=1 Tax=Paraburkholderia heleia TaxID=634127 RepID=UPI0005A9AF92|nr:heme-binding protein [Paraburkholderia heleia]